MGTGREISSFQKNIVFEKLNIKPHPQNDSLILDKDGINLMESNQYNEQNIQTNRKDGKKIIILEIKNIFIIF
jgi:hypothetical protein